MNKTKKHRSQSLSERIRRINPVKRQQVRTRMQIAVNLDEALKAKGWKRTQLADALGVDNSLITKWLSGTHNSTTDTLVQLSMVLEVKLSELISEEGIDNTKTAVATVFKEAAKQSVSSDYQADITVNADQTHILNRRTGKSFPLPLDTQSTYQFSTEKLNPEDQGTFVA
jgi:transcriptional regulator with XRE-family HTH domain